MKNQLIKALLVAVVVAAIAVLIMVDHMGAKSIAIMTLLVIARLARRKMGLPARMPTKDEAKLGYNLEESMPVNAHHNHLHHMSKDKK